LLHQTTVGSADHRLACAWADFQRFVKGRHSGLRFRLAMDAGIAEVAKADSIASTTLRLCKRLHKWP
jgi:hypothetical protein